MKTYKAGKRFTYKRCNVKTCIHNAAGYCTCCSEGCELFEKLLFQEY